MGYAGGVNLYGYCGGSSVGRFDPLGYGWRRFVGGLAGGVLGGILSGGNPLAIYGGIMAGSALSDAGDQAAEGNDPDWGQATIHGAEDTALAIAGSYVIGKCAGLVRGLVGKGSAEVAEHVVPFDDHHVIPQELDANLRESGISEGLLKETRPLPRTFHTGKGGIHTGEGFGRGGAYNKWWKDKLRNLGPDISDDDIQDIIGELDGYFGW